MTTGPRRYRGPIHALLLLMSALAALTPLSWGGSLEAQTAGTTPPAVEEGLFPGADGVKLIYRKVGTGLETAVYLHGGPLNLADGGYALDALAEGRTLIAFQQRSGGRSQLVGDK